MNKRMIPKAPDFSDLGNLVSDTAAPMTATAETTLPASLRVVSNDPSPSPAPKTAKASPASQAEGEASTANLENLNFKVPRSFRKRFRDCAYRADLKQNELLFAALDAWEALNKN